MKALKWVSKSPVKAEAGMRRALVFLVSPTCDCQRSPILPIPCLHRIVQGCALCPFAKNWGWGHGHAWQQASAVLVPASPSCSCADVPCCVSHAQKADKCNGQCCPFLKQSVLPVSQQSGVGGGVHGCLEHARAEHRWSSNAKAFELTWESCMLLSLYCVTNQLFCVIHDSWCLSLFWI